VEIYETEEEQVAALKDWWKVNSTSVISGVLGAAVIVGGWNFWQSYQQEKMDHASAVYEQLIVAAEADKTDSVNSLADKLSTEYDSTAYGAYGLLFQAKAQVEQQDLAGAKETLQQAISSSSDVQLKHVARTRLIRVFLASNEYEQGLQLVADVDQSSLGGFEGVYEELKGDLYVAMARIGEARTAYQAALKAGESSPLLQFKLDDLTLADSDQG